MTHVRVTLPSGEAAVYDAADIAIARGRDSVMRYGTHVATRFADGWRLAHRWSPVDLGDNGDGTALIAWERWGPATAAESADLDRTVSLEHAQRLMLVDALTARLTSYVHIAPRLARECANNAVCGADGETPLATALRSAIEHRVRTLPDWRHVCDVEGIVAAVTESLDDWTADEVETFVKVTP